MNHLQEHPDNDKIITQVLADKIEQARYNQSLNKVCDDLGIDQL